MNGNVTFIELYNIRFLFSMNLEKFITYERDIVLPIRNFVLVKHVVVLTRLTDLIFSNIDSVFYEINMIPMCRRGEGTSEIRFEFFSFSIVSHN